jgi:hypothetical protein
MVVLLTGDSGEILDMDSVPPQYLDHVEVDEMGYTTLPNDKFEELRGELKGLSAGKPKKKWKAPFQSRPGSFAFGDSPDPQDVHDEFLNLRDRYRYGEVPIQKLADELGIHVNRIDFNGTGLRVMDGVVTELLGDTPYRTDR